MAEIDLPRRVILLCNRLEELGRLHAFVTQFCQAAGLPADDAFALSLALDELVTNAIVHGYADGGEHGIEVASADLHQRQVGGLGLHFVRRAVDEMTYRRIDGRNRLRLRKRVASASAKRE
jgi:anti-sigma regulatory factor (Ser/Thr protein kinase)